MKKIIIASLLIVSNGLFATVLTPIAKSTCQSAYLDLFAKDEINVSVAFGYDDLENGKTNDRTSLNLFVKTLTGKCLTWDQRMCGFKVKSSIGITVLTKEMFGPDARTKTVNIILGNSSVSDNDAANRRNPLQKTQTEAMRKLFADGLENSEITFYQGHSRDGGGPSFGPPKLSSQGHVDYDYYHKHKTDKQFMLKALSKAPNRSRIVGIVSCSSIRWFSKNIGAEAPGSGIIGTTDTFATNNFAESLTFLENIFSYQCLKNLKVKGLNGASIVQGKELKIPEKNQKLTKAELDQRSLNNLVAYLRSPDQETRRSAFREIKIYDAKLYGPKVQQELSNYTFGNTMFNFFSGQRD